MEPNLAESIYIRSSIKFLHLVPFGQQTWPLLIKIEHMVKLHVFGNNSKTVNNIRNLMGLKMINTARSNYPEILKKICKYVQHVKIYLACNFKVNLITYLGVIALFSSNFSNFNTFRFLFQKL